MITVPVALSIMMAPALSSGGETGKVYDVQQDTTLSWILPSGSYLLYAVGGPDGLGLEYGFSTYSGTPKQFLQSEEFVLAAIHDESREPSLRVWSGRGKVVVTEGAPTAKLLFDGRVDHALNISAHRCGGALLGTSDARSSNLRIHVAGAGISFAVYDDNLTLVHSASEVLDVMVSQASMFFYAVQACSALPSDRVVVLRAETVASDDARALPAGPPLLAVAAAVLMALLRRPRGS